MGNLVVIDSKLLLGDVKRIEWNGFLLVSFGILKRCEYYKEWL